MIEDKPTVLCCSPVSDHREPVAGSITNVCDRCGQEIWVAPSSQTLIEQGVVDEKICMDCARAEQPAPENWQQLFAAIDRGEALMSTMEQFEEIRKELRRRAGSG